MKVIVLLLTSVVLCGSLRAQKTVINDPNAELRSVRDFHGIEVSGNIDLYLSQGEQETVVVSAKDQKWRDHIRTDVENGILKIRVDNPQWLWPEKNKKMKAYVSFTTLNQLKASGSSDIYVDGVIAGPSLDLRLAGASDFKGAVRVNELSIDQSGASDAVITGTVSVLTTIHVAGASDVKGYDLVTENCNAHATGASDIHITVNKELNVHAGGASSVLYKGNAVIKDMHSSGASSVSKKD